MNDTDKLLRELIKEIRISRNVQLMSDLVVALQKHMEILFNQLPTKERMDSFYLNPIELYAYCINNGYIEDDGDGFFTDSPKFAKEHFDISNYPEIMKLSENEEKK